ncbi:unnamed protein product [Gongylonema pulchrum]|uniref:Transmembrane protein n=1 Tax=Gongylonema pulchrum TaxID=637853 RepID=A0A183DJV7_9BILA|nr:unnamed protein product [Gongylonema pulchrum]
MQEQPLLDMFGVMSVCNRAQFEHVRRSKRSVCKARAQAKVSMEQLHAAQISKRFTVLLVTVLGVFEFHVMFLIVLIQAYFL